MGRSWDWAHHLHRLDSLAWLKRPQPQYPSISCRQLPRSTENSAQSVDPRLIRPWEESFGHRATWQTSSSLPSSLLNPIDRSYRRQGPAFRIMLPQVAWSHSHQSAPSTLTSSLLRYCRRFCLLTPEISLKLASMVSIPLHNLCHGLAGALGLIWWHSFSRAWYFSDLPHWRTISTLCHRGSSWRLATAYPQAERTLWPSLLYCYDKSSIRLLQRPLWRGLPRSSADRLGSWRPAARLGSW